MIEYYLNETDRYSLNTLNVSRSRLSADGVDYQVFCLNPRINTAFL